LAHPVYIYTQISTKKPEGFKPIRNSSHGREYDIKIFFYIFKACIKASQHLRIEFIVVSLRMYF